MGTSEAIVIRTYPNDALANMAHSRLRFEGIEAEIRKDDCGGAYPSLQMCRGVQLLVNSEDAVDAEKILHAMESEGSEQIEREAEQQNYNRKLTWQEFDSSSSETLPSEHLEQLKTSIYLYVVIGPLISALFADKIDNFFVACLLFVGFVGTAFLYLRNELGKLQESIKAQEKKLMQMEASLQQIHD